MLPYLLWSSIISYSYVSGISVICTHIVNWDIMHTYVYCTVENIDGRKLWRITAFCQVFSPIFTISISFPMQMDLNSPTSYGAYSPNYFTTKVSYCMVTYINYQHYSYLSCLIYLPDQHKHSHKS